jgi:hypothetical protein
MPLGADNQRVRLALLVVVALAGTSSGGCGGGQPHAYSVGETKAAFARQGLELVADPGAPASTADRLLVPWSGESFFVVVAPTVREVDEAWPDEERMQDERSFVVLRANVGVFADTELHRADRVRVLKALGALPDRGSEVVIAGR